MESKLRGIVMNGVITLETPLPDGTQVEVRVLSLAMPPEWQDEFAAWNRASAKALELPGCCNGSPGSPRHYGRRW